MTTIVYDHAACLLHDPGPFTGMGPARLRAVMAALQAPGFERLEWRSAEAAPLEYLYLVHTPDYVADVLVPIPEGEQRDFGMEAIATSNTAQAALRSAGLVAEAVRTVARGEARNAFCIVSPGGHHAEMDTAQGFCFFNHVAMGAALVQSLHGMPRVAVLDFDAHHGNGTQSLFWNHRERLLVSLHEDTGLSGFASEQGAHGNILNIPLPPGTDGAAFRQAMRSAALLKLEAFRPDLLLVSAGFDMHGDDPLADMNLAVDDYAWTGRALSSFADAHCSGGLVAVLEGGYDLNALGSCAAAFVSGLMKEANDHG